MSSPAIRSGRPPLPRRRARPEFTAHVLGFLKEHEINFRQLCRTAFSGDDSNPTYLRAAEIANGQAVPDSLVYRARLKALARASRWPDEVPADEPVKTTPLIPGR